MCMQKTQNGLPTSVVRPAKSTRDFFPIRTCPAHNWGRGKGGRYAVEKKKEKERKNEGKKKSIKR